MFFSSSYDNGQSKEIDNDGKPFVVSMHKDDNDKNLKT
jgi:hypothetical protein